MKDLKYYADKAYKILHKTGTSAETNYGRSKRIITSLFSMSEENYIETVISRLTLIDSYYSTQINSKRLFGIDEIAHEIVGISDSSKILIKKCTEFLISPYDSKDIRGLFEHKNYGIHKDGKLAGQAPSLISKYLYFLMKYQFPIYDTLAISSYKKLKLKYNNLHQIPELNEKFAVSFFDGMKQLNNITGIKDYGKLDNLLWLLGKITEGSLSIIIDRPSYEKITENSRVADFFDYLIEKNKQNGSKNNKITPDEVIRDYLMNYVQDDLNKLFDDEDVTDFFIFSLQFCDNKKLIPVEFYELNRS